MCTRDVRDPGETKMASRWPGRPWSHESELQRIGHGLSQDPPSQLGSESGQSWENRSGKG